MTSPHARAAPQAARAHGGPPRRRGPPTCFLGLEGPAILPTSHFLLTRRADVEDVIDRAAMGVIHGDAGLGKTFAVQAALAAPDDWAIATMSFPNRADHAPGRRHPAARHRRDAQPRLQPLPHHGAAAGGIRAHPMAGRGGEAQRLNGVCIEYLRHLHDHPATRLALLLVGGNGCWEVLSREPMLGSRVWRRVGSVRSPMPRFCATCAATTGCTPRCPTSCCCSSMTTSPMGAARLGRVHPVSPARMRPPWPPAR